MTVRELARSDVIAVPRDALVTHVAELMEEESVGSVLVVEEERPVGIVTDRDLTLEVVARGSDPTTLTAADVMTPDPVVVEEDEGVYEALNLAGDRGIRRLPVVSKDGTLSGIVALDDFVVLLASELENVSDIIQTESPPY